MMLFATTLPMAVACSDDDDEVTEPKVEVKQYTLPQGDHDYDARIVDFYNRTGVYILYKFDDADAYFTGNNEWGEYYCDTVVNHIWYKMEEGEVYVSGDSAYVHGVSHPLNERVIRDEDGTWEEYSVVEGQLLYQEQELQQRGSFTVEPADEAYVGEQLEWLEDNFLSFYSDSTLRECLPLKILLGKNLKELTYEPPSPWSAGGYILNETMYYSSFNNLIIGYGDGQISEMQQNYPYLMPRYRRNLNSWFIDNCLKSKMNLEEFNSVSNWTTRPSNSELYALGLLTRPGSDSPTQVSYNNEFDAYVELLFDYTYEELTEEPRSSSYSSYDYTGVLNPKKDVNGLIMRKYNLLKAEFERLGVNTEAVGKAIRGY